MPILQMKSLQEIQERVATLFPDKKTEEQYRAATPRQLEFLPQKYVFKNGVRAIVRNMRTDEDVILYEMMKEAMEAGDGYGISEYPTLSVFRGTRLMNDVCGVVEEQDTGRIMGCFITRGESLFARHGRPGIARSMVLMSKKFRGKGIGEEITALELGISRDIGNTHILNNTTIGNDKMMKIISNTPGLAVIGTIQKALYFEGKGWVDIMIGALDLVKYGKSFAQLIEENKIKAKQFFTSKI